MKTCVDCGKKISYKSTRCRSCAMRLRWARGDYTPALRRKIQQASVLHHREWTPQRRLKHSLAVKAAHDRGAYDNAYGEVHRRKVSEAAKAAHARGCYDEAHKQYSELNRGAGNPNWRGGKITRVCEFCGTEFKVFPRTLRRGQGRFCSTNCTAKALSGPNAPGWQGGISFEPYPPEFNEAFKKQIRERDKYSCAICRFPGNHVHHIDYCKENTKPNNCITLCVSCHAPTNYNRKYWQTILQEIVNNRYRFEVTAGEQAPFGLETRPDILEAIKVQGD